MDLGTVPDWIAAIGTAGALLVAIALLARELRDRRTAQARLVAAWITELKTSADIRVTSLVVQNRSDEPVYDVEVWWLDPVAHEEVGAPGELEFSVEVLPPDTRHVAAESMPTRMGTIPRLTLAFTDTAGRRWTRAGGTLRRKWRKLTR